MKYIYIYYHLNKIAFYFIFFEHHYKQYANQLQILTIKM